MSGLRAAVIALIEDAPERVVLSILRTLVDAVAPASARAPEPPMRRPAQEKPTAKAAAKPTAAVSDPAWDTLRREVRRRMAAGGLDFAGLGQAIGRSGTAVRIDLTSRRPPRPNVQAKLKAWLEQGAPEVAAVIGTTFRPNGASRVHASTDLGLSTAD